MKPQFDRYAENYDSLLDEAISISGETKDYFSRARIALLSACLEGSGIYVRSVLDFGCGTGAAAPHFFECLRAERILGADPSRQMIEAATRLHGSDRATFVPLDEYQPTENFDLVFCNGVFHHIPNAERAKALSIIKGSLQPRGVFSFWENNPWNPGARYIMKKCAFDQDAEKISPPKARQMLADAGFRIFKAGYHFIFPRMLRALRVVEPMLASLPIGAQYHILSRK